MSDRRPVCDALREISARRPVGASALMLVAHPDDEVLGCSVAMRQLPRLRLVHATDGAAGDRALATQRMREAAAALAAMELTPSMAPCGLPDRSLIEHVGALASALNAWLPETAILITHAMEGGHPDHDACAMAAQIACAREERRSGRRIARLEFAVYARAEGEILTNAFSRAAQAAATALQLTTEERMRKRCALQASTSQRHVVDRFALLTETLRPAPDYDFSAPRDAEDLLFAFAHPEREAAWRRAATAALAS